jgi:RNA polymerase sigma-70 factor, ECF subfamily
VARRYAGREAEDIVQDVYVRALSHGERFRGQASPTTWLHRMVINACVDEWRRRRSRAAKQTGYARATPKEPMLPEQLWTRAAIRTLSDADRRMCLLHDVMGYTHREIAVLHGIAAGTSKTRLMRARSRLRAALAGQEAADAL